MDYELLIFADKETLSAYSVRDRAYCSMEGEESFDFRDSSDLEKFTLIIVNGCGGRAFSDYDFSVAVINLGADLDVLFQLHKLLKGCKEINILDVKKVLPLVALNRGLGKNETKVFTFGDLAWKVTSHAEDKTVTVQEVEVEDGEELTPEDFVLLYEFRAMVQFDEEEIAKIKAECEEKIKQNEADYQKKMRELKVMEAKAKDIDNLVKDKDYKLQLLSRFTDDKDILDHPEAVACNQEEFDNLLQQNKEQKIYLFYKELILTNPEEVKNVRLVGVVPSIIKIFAKTFINFERNGVTFENIRFDPAYHKVYAKNFKKVGDIIALGEYHSEPIEWQILDIKDGKALLLSKYALACKQYHTSNANVTWENCSLRKWLNEEFLQKAMVKVSHSTVVERNVPAHYNPKYSTDPGNDTKDKLFLLSVKEVLQYLKTDKERICYPKVWVQSEGAWVSYDNGPCCWWLRSPGYDANFAAYVYDSGSVNYYGPYVSCDYHVVRPACWVDLSKLE